MGNHVSLARNVLLYTSVSKPLCDTYRFLFSMKRNQSVALGKKWLTNLHQDEWCWWAEPNRHNCEVTEQRILFSESLRFLSHNLSPWLAYILITTYIYICMYVYMYIYCVCVCVCYLGAGQRQVRRALCCCSLLIAAMSSFTHTHARAHAHTMLNPLRAIQPY